MRLARLASRERAPGRALALQEGGAVARRGGGDGSSNADGACFEGVVIAGEATDATDAAIESNLHAVFTQ